MDENTFLMLRMALEPEEEEQVMVDLWISKKPQLQLIGTERALYRPERKVLAVSDDNYTERIPLEEIKSISFSRSSKTMGQLIGGMLIFVGILLLMFMFIPLTNLIQGETSLDTGIGDLIKYSALAIISGLMFFFMGGTKRIMVIQTSKKKIKWVSPFAIGGGVNKEVDGCLMAIETWAAVHGIPSGNDANKFY